MQSNYFAGCIKVDHVKTRYRELAMQHHPDRGGDTATMQAINAAYVAVLQSFDGIKGYTTDNKEYTYRYDAGKESALMEAIDALLKLKMRDVDLMLIGTWLWITGDTKPHAAAIKAIGARYHGKRQCWYFQRDGFRKRRYSGKSLDSLAAAYGSQSYRPQYDPELN